MAASSWLSPLAKPIGLGCRNSQNVGDNDEVGGEMVDVFAVSILLDSGRC